MGFLKKVLVFGTYDLLHAGHEHHLRKAAKHGLLHVVIARDATVEKIKSKLPLHGELVRLKNVASLGFVHEAVLGNKKDKYKIIEKINPDIICLGYDQHHFTDNLKDFLKEKKMKTKIIRFKKAHKPEKFKTSILRKKIKV